MYAARSLRRLLAGPRRAVGDHEHLPADVPGHAGVKHLQRAAGNGAVASALGGPHVAAEDPAHEAKADAVARRASLATPIPDQRGTLSGAPLAEPHQSLLQRFVDGDLGSVRIHTGPSSQRAAQELGAHAYAQGTDIHFGPGEYDPGSRQGLGLLAHEVAHAVQHPTAPSADGPQLVHAKLRGSRKALEGLGGKKKGGKLSSKWNDLLARVSAYETLEMRYLAAVNGGTGDTAAGKALKAKLLKELQKLEKAALSWRKANKEDAAQAEVNRLRTRQAIDHDDEDLRYKHEKRQAISLFLVRVKAEAADLRSGRFELGGGLDDFHLTATKDSAVGGEVNRLDYVAYSAGSPIEEGYFKEDRAFHAAIQAHEKDVGIHQHDPNYGGRSMAMYRLDQLLGGGVIARTEFAVHTSATPSGAKSKVPAATRTKFGFVTEKAAGTSMGDLLKGDRVTRTAREHQRAAKPGEVIDLEDATLQRCLNKLQVIDVIAGQLDRHEGNYHVQHDATGKVVGVTGIDNDMAFGANMTTPDHRSALFSENYLALPDLIDRDFGQRILKVTDADLRSALDGLLTTAEIDATISRFKAVQDHVKKQQANTLVSTWGAGTAQTQMQTAVNVPRAMERSLVGRVGETTLLVNAGRDVQEWLASQGFVDADNSTLRSELETLVRAGTLDVGQMLPVAREVFARIVAGLQPTNPGQPKPQYPSVGAARILAVLKDVLSGAPRKPARPSGGLKPLPQGRGARPLPPPPASSPKLRAGNAAPRTAGPPQRKWSVPPPTTPPMPPPDR